MMFDRRLLQNFDWFLLLLVILIATIGMLVIYSATIDFDFTNQVSYVQKQFFFFLLGLFIMFVVTLIDYRILGNVSFILYLLSVVLLVLVLFYGVGGHGTPVKRWLKIGSFFFQPSEFVKFTLVLYLSHYFREPKRIGNIGFKGLLWPLFVTLVPFVLILRQPDLGTAGLLILIFIPIIFLAGLKYKYILVPAIFIFFVSWISWILLFNPYEWLFIEELQFKNMLIENGILREYQIRRIETLLNPESDPLGAGYHIIQSKIAIGSGQFWGKGFLQSTQAQFNFLPARHTDFIFSVFSEEWGFIGSITLLSLYAFFLNWCLKFIQVARDRAGTILTLGITAIFTIHIIINIAMILGLFPIVGIPLPFFSYGGSAMISMMIGVGLLLNVRMRRFDL